MRNFQTLDRVEVNEQSGIINMSAEDDAMYSVVAMRREGGYVAISASFGPIEIALRPRFQELARVLGRLQPVEGLQTTRQVGTGQSYVALGLRPDGILIMRPSIVADATGHLSFNLFLTSAVRETLFSWLPVEERT